MPDPGPAPIPSRDIARAKINLYLHVTGRRPDGYHLLDSLAVFGPCADTIDIRADETGRPGDVRLVIEGRFGAGLARDADNLVLRAARALQASAPARRFAPVVLTLGKELPVASGIGGGSADAACALRLLSRLWDLECDLPQIAAGLGADVPVCLAQVPARMEGIGEILTPAPALPRCAMLLVNHGAAVSTQAVFRARAPGSFGPPADLSAHWPDVDAMLAGLRRTRNDLQDAAIALCPEIGDVLAAIASSPGCGLARMSGSGATCFGLFADAEDARRAAEVLAARYGWWTAQGPIGHAGA